MEFLFEVIFELIIDGTVEGINSKKVPLAIRVVLAVLLFGLYFGFGGILIYAGIKKGVILLSLVGVVLIVAIPIMLLKRRRESGEQ